MSDIDTVVVDSLKALDPGWPIREADIECARLTWIKAKVQELFYCRRCCPFSQENVMKR